MSIFSSRAIASYGYFGQAFGGGANVIFGPFAFTAPFSYRDFTGTEHFQGKVKQFTPLTWAPPSTTILARAAQVWAVWEAAADAGSPAAVTYVKNTTQKMNEAIGRVDPLSMLSNMFGDIPVDSDLQRYELFRTIKTAVLAVANSSAAATAAYNAVSAGGGPATDLPDLTLKKDASTSGGGPTAGGGPGGAAPHDEGGFPWVYVGAAAGGLVLLAGGYYLLKPRQMSGYRRRRSRR